jgi:hypothetical protein
MSALSSKKVGENELQRFMRLFKSLDQSFSDEGKALHIVLYADGSGRLDVDEDHIFSFVSIDMLLSYLEASPLHRLLMTANHR